MWDEYCLICGGPHDLIPIQEVIADEAAVAKEQRRRPLRVSEIKKAYVKTSWLTKAVGVSEEETRLELGPYDFYGSFEMKDGQLFHGATNFRYGNVPAGDLYGLTMHKSCAKLIKSKLKYQIKFADIWPTLLIQDYGNYFTDSKYGGISKYYSQFFEVAQLIADGNEYLLRDPTHDERNASRIIALWRPLVEKIRKNNRMV